MNKKLLAALLVVLLAVSVFMVFQFQPKPTETVEMTSAIIDSYSETNRNDDVYVAAVWDAADSSQGQTFTTPAYAVKLTSAKFYLCKNNAPTGNIRAEIYAHTGTYGVNGKPTGSILAYSDSVDSSTLNSSPNYALVTFTFSGTQRIVLTASTHYCLCLTGVSEVITATHQVFVGVDTSSPSHSGNYCWGGPNWSGSGAFDVCFYVYAQKIPTMPEAPEDCVFTSTGKVSKFLGGVTGSTSGITMLLDDGDGNSRDKMACPFTLTDDNVEVTQLNVACKNGSTDDGPVTVIQGFIYSNVAGNPTDLIAVTQEVGVNWKALFQIAELPFPTPIILSKGTYWIGVIRDYLEDWDAQFQVQYDAAATNGTFIAEDDYSDGVSDPWGTTFDTLDYNLFVFATYYIPNPTPASQRLTGKTVLETVDPWAVRWQDKSFYAVGRYWVFFTGQVETGPIVFPGKTYRGYYTSSADGETWKTPISVGSLIEPFGENLQAILGEGNRVHVFGRALSGGVGIGYRSGICNSDGSVTWTQNDWVNAFTQGGSWTVDFYACLDSRGYPWITWGYANAGLSDVSPYITKSSTKDGTWTTVAGYPYQLADGTGEWLTNNFVVPLNNGRVYAFYFKAGAIIKGKLWNVVSWSAEEEVSSSYIIKQYATGKESWSRGCTVDEQGTIHLVFLRAEWDDDLGYEVIYIKRDSSGWSSETVVGTGLIKKNVCPSIALYEGYINIFWIENDFIVSKQYDYEDNRLGDINYKVDEQENGFPYDDMVTYGKDGLLNPFVKLFNDRIGVLWIANTETAGTYAIKFAIQNLTGEYMPQDLSFFNAIKKALKKQHALDFTVTRQKLHLGAQVPDTGHYACTYTDKSIEMIIFPKGSDYRFTGIGYFTRYNGLGVTTDAMLEGDKITDGQGRQWLVQIVTPYFYGVLYKFSVCDLELAPE